MRLAPTAFAACLALAGCSPERPVTVCAAGAQEWTRSELYFGLSTPDGPVTDDRFTAFLDAEVSSRFPEGLTLLEGAGRWRAPSGETVSEPTRVVVLLHPSEPGNAMRIEEIRNLYKTRFKQQSVLLVQRQGCVSF